MAERSLAVSLLIGGKISPSVNRSFQQVEARGIRSAKSVSRAQSRIAAREAARQDKLQQNRNRRSSIQGDPPERGSSRSRLGPTVKTGHRV